MESKHKGLDATFVIRQAKTVRILQHEVVLKSV